MIVLPIGRENAVIQRHAWITWSLITINVAAFIVFCVGSSHEDRVQLILTWRSTITYLRDRPYLRVPWQAAQLMPRELRKRAPVSDPSINDWTKMKEQEELDAMATELRDRYNTTADVRLAYVPAAASIPALITSMFLHAGILHLVGNMLFLFATAPFIEDVYGRPLFAALYLTGGAVATLAFAARYPTSVIPLVGASGAIAALMGAYLFRFARSRMQFLFIPIVFLPFWNFRLALPALIVLPLWFLEQIVSIPAEGDSGVAVTAHVAGFAYGLVFAVVVKLTRIEERHIKPAIEKQISTIADPRLERGVAAFYRDDLAEARRDVDALLAEQPANPDALRLALNIALKKNEWQSIDAFATRLLASYSGANDRALAIDLIAELNACDHPLRQFLARGASFMERSGDRRQAIELCERLAEIETGTANAIPALVKLANLRRSGGDVFGAREALKRALNQPECSAEWRRRIDSTLALM